MPLTTNTVQLPKSSLTNKGSNHEFNKITRWMIHKALYKAETNLTEEDEDGGGREEEREGGGGGAAFQVISSE